MDDHDSTTDANVEPAFGDAPQGQNQAPRISTPCRVHFHHVRGRLADIDGISGKAVLDGVVCAGILADDSTQQVTEVTHSQTKGKPEVTRITLTWEV